jgi:protein-S-isoprenylcysteine O-methyltransferase Ste14
MQPNLLALIDSLWIAFLAIWAIGAARTKRTARSQPFSTQLLQRGLAAVGGILLFAPGLSASWLGFRLLPDSIALAYLGVALTAGGLGFAVWARFALGRNWSGNVTIKKDHELILRGPYTLVRHPIYSGLLLALLGTAIYVNELRGLIAVAMVFVGFWLKARNEESFMLQQFGEQYRRYQRDVRALIPFLL